LLDVASTPGEITEAGLRQNVSVGIRYIASWLNGVGAAAIFNLMEDAATAEISRSQVWQWLHHRKIAESDVRSVIEEEATQVKDLPRAAEAQALFEQVALSGDFVEFLTVPAYERLD
jgi:malate synthase